MNQIKASKQTIKSTAIFFFFEGKQGRTLDMYIINRLSISGNVIKNGYFADAPYDH